LSHEPGTYLGAVRTLDDLKGRCYIEPGCDCWHLRSSRGRPMPKDRRHAIWLFGKGSVTATRAALELAGRPVRKGYRAVRTCESYDCVNPEHLKAWTKAQEGAWHVKRGTSVTPRKTIANRLMGAKRSRISTEVRRWVVESPQTGSDIAHAIGVFPSYVYAIRVQARAAFGVMP